MRGQVGAAGLRKAAQPTECMSPRHGGRVCARALIVSASRHLTLTAAYLLIAALLLRAVAGFDWRGVAVALTSYLAIAGLVLLGLNRHGGQPRFGAANAMTLMRAAVAALFVGVLDDAKLTETLASNCDARWTLTGFAAAGLLSDGADGWLARRTGTASEFGARFDMETDALFMLALSLLVHALGEIGGWVLLSGLLRYLFVGRACCGHRSRRLAVVSAQERLWDADGDPRCGARSVNAKPMGLGAMRGWVEPLDILVWLRCPLVGLENRPKAAMRHSTVSQSPPA